MVDGRTLSMRITVVSRTGLVAMRVAMSGWTECTFASISAASMSSAGAGARTHASVATTSAICSAQKCLFKCNVKGRGGSQRLSQFRSESRRSNFATQFR
jgi:hypothetical protein